MHIPEGYIAKNYNLKGRNWIRQLREEAPEDFAALMHNMRAAGQYGRAGGKARAKNGLRCARCKQFATRAQLTNGRHTDGTICDESIARYRRLMEVA